ncbi:MAG: hypothetical protein ACC634_00060 [Hyphomicrobiales bacterium]
MSFSKQSANQQAVLVTGIFFLAFLPLLVWVPTLFPHPGDVVSPAQAEGYNNRVAHLLAVGWIVASAAAVFLLVRAAHPGAEPPATHEAVAQGRKTGDLLQILAVILAVLLLYFPPALARYGPYLEESIHLGALHRMLAGDVPYRDFEFLYGPLMLYAAYFWVWATEYSLRAFYTYVALLEVIVFLAILLPVQKYLAGFWARLGAFVLLASLYFNPLVGPNQNGLRKIAGVLLLLSVAARPWSPVLWLVHGLGLGALLSYSQEFGAATALGIAAIYATLLIKNRERRAIVALAVIALVSAATWLGLTFFLLGADAEYYFKTLAYLTGRFDAGEAAFRFYWTVNGAAVFGLLFLAAWHVGRSLARPWVVPASAGDLIFAGGLVYALVMLKSGLSRADQWHLVPGVLVLVFAFVLPISAGAAPLGRIARRIGIGLAVLLALSYSFGQIPHARYVFREGLMRGYGDLASGVPANHTPAVIPARPALAFERSYPNAELRDLSAFLATPPQRDRRIFTYGSPWGISFLVGATKTGILGDDYIYGDDRGDAMRAYLDSQPETLVIIRKDDYNWLLEGPDAAIPERKFYLMGYGIWRELRAKVSSVHIRGVVIEERQKKARLRRLVGMYVIAQYHPIYTDGPYYVLERNSG